MKKMFIILIAIFLLSTVFTIPTYTIWEEQSAAIQKLLDDACRISGVPGMSISIISGDETLYFSSGYADRERRLPATENTLYELASVSKAFTGTGILLLEEQGLLSMSDPIQKYLPWISFEYKGAPIDMQSLTLNHFLHHTSGITNENHFQDISQGSSEDMLQKTVETLKGAELEFPPGQRYKYGTINYDVLGLVIEVVSGKSYERFMDEEVFKPLGLYHTYLYEEDVQSSGQLAQGYRTSFLITSPYDAPVYAGNKPAGYIISSSEDMARWMKIQMGIVEDVSELFKAVIKKSHQGNKSVSDDNGMYYGAGWSINSDTTIIEHGGVNPNFSTQVTIFPNEKLALTFLTNNAHTNNINLVKGIKEILEGNFTQSYQRSATQLWDIVLSSTTIIFTILAIIFFLLGLVRKKRNKQKLVIKKRVHITAWLTVTITILIISWIFPKFIGYDWSTLLVWQPYSLIAALISLVILSASITWFVWRVSI